MRPQYVDNLILLPSHLCGQKQLDYPQMHTQHFVATGGEKLKDAKGKKNSLEFSPY